MMTHAIVWTRILYEHEFFHGPQNCFNIWPLLALKNVDRLIFMSSIDLKKIIVFFKQMVFHCNEHYN